MATPPAPPAVDCRLPGRVELILGPMFSGKTTELIRRITRYRFANFRCLVIKYEGDSRYSKEAVATHDSRSISAVSCTVLKGQRDKAMDHEVIGIDEGQFFPDTVDFCEDMANTGKVVVVAALDGTFQRTGFGNFLNLVPLAESVVKLHAVCMVCCRRAAFTRRMTEDKAVEVIGGADKYMAVCRGCYHGPRELKRSPLKALQDPGLTPAKRRLTLLELAE